MNPKVIVGITGGSGSGKTKLATSLFNSIGVEKATFLQQDNYYKDQSHLHLRIRNTLNYDHPDVFDNDLYIDQIHRLREGSAIEIPVYDFTTHARLDRTNIVKAAGTIILDGILLFRDNALRDLIDLKIYVDTDSDIRLIRRLKRDVLERGRTVDSVINQYINTVKPMHERFVEPQREYADMIVSGNGHIEDGTSAVLSKIREMRL